MTTIYGACATFTLHEIMSERRFDDVSAELTLDNIPYNMTHYTHLPLLKNDKNCANLQDLQQIYDTKSVVGEAAIPILDRVDLQGFCAA